MDLRYLVLLAAALGVAGYDSCPACAGVPYTPNPYSQDHYAWVLPITTGTKCLTSLSVINPIRDADWTNVVDFSEDCPAGGSAEHQNVATKVHVSAEGPAGQPIKNSKKMPHHYGTVQTGPSSCICSTASCACEIEVFAQSDEFISVDVERLNLASSGQLITVQINGEDAGRCGATGDYSSGCGQTIKCVGYGATRLITGATGTCGPSNRCAPAAAFTAHPDRVLHATALLTSPFVGTGSNAVVAGSIDWSQSFAFTATITTTQGGTIFSKSRHTGGTWRQYDKAFFVHGGVAQFSVGFVGDVTSTTNVADGLPHIVSLTFDHTTNTFKIYVDRVLEGTAIIDPHTDPVDDVTVVGHGATDYPARSGGLFSGDTYFIGTISSAVVYDSTRLPDQHIIRVTASSAIGANTCGSTGGPAGRRLQAFASVSPNPSTTNIGSEFYLLGASFRCWRGLTLDVPTLRFVCHDPRFSETGFFALGNCESDNTGGWVADQISPELGVSSTEFECPSGLTSTGIGPVYGEQVYFNGVLYPYDDPAVSQYWISPEYFYNGNCRIGVVSFTGTLGHQPTVVTASVTSTPAGPDLCGYILTSHHTYSDTDGDLEGTSTYQWYTADDEAGTNLTPIPGATSSTYLPGTVDIGKYIFVQIQPVAVSGWRLGQPVRVLAAYVGVSFC